MRSVQLGSISSMKYGKLPPKEILDSGYPIFTGYRVSGYSKEYLYRDAMLIVVARGVGGTGDVKIAPEQAWITNLSIVLDLDSSQVDKHFLYYRLGQEALKDKLNTGSAQAQITIEALSQYEISVPDLASQRQMATVLRAYDDLIAINQRRIALLEDAARRLYREWFVHLRFPGYESVPVKDGVPEGWRKQTLASVADVNARSIGARDRPDSVLYIDISTVSTGLIGEVTPYAFADAPGRARRRVVHGDVIWSCVRPNRRSYALIWEPDERLVASTGFAVLSATGVPFSYLYFTTTTDAFVGHLEQNATGAAYPAVTAKTFEDAEILVPDGGMLAAFDRSVLLQLEQTEFLKQQNRTLAQARDLLLPKLMSGQLDVSGINLPEEVAP